MSKYRFLQFLVLLTLVLLFIGGFVTSTDSGLAVPDWPLSYGTLTPPMVGGIRFEHTHRMVAATVGLFTLVLAIWIGWTERRKEIRWLALAALGAVVLQGILGGLTVLFRLPAPISVAHACLGPVFFSLVVTLATLMKPDGQGRAGDDANASSFSQFSRLTTLSIFLQILFGAIVRHTHHAIGLHVASAFLVLILTGLLVSRAPHSRGALFLGFLVIAEFFLGIGTFVFTRVSGIPHGPASILFPTIHQTLGALILATSVVVTLRSMKVAPRPSLSPYLQLTKPRLVFLSLWSVAVGFFIASPSLVDWALLFKTLGATALVAAGSMALNEYLERDTDALMRRTADRPLPSGRMTPSNALIFGCILSFAGILALTLNVNLLVSLLALLTWASYLFVYTPLKRKTPLCTWWGALPGAIPPLIGWAAARGSLGAGAWVLFAILFAWQLPHFFAIAWIYREDYQRAGLRMLSVVDPTGFRIGSQIMMGTLVVHLLSFLPPIFGVTGQGYYLGALLLGIWFIASSFQTAFQLDSRSRSFFRRSVVYLSLLLLLMILDKTPV